MSKSSQHVKLKPGQNSIKLVNGKWVAGVKKNPTVSEYYELWVWNGEGYNKEVIIGNGNFGSLSDAKHRMASHIGVMPNCPVKLVKISIVAEHKP